MANTQDKAEAMRRIKAAESPQDKLSAVMAELHRRGVKNDYCSRCGTHEWNVDLLEVPANSVLSLGAFDVRAFQPEAFGTTLPSSHLSLLAVVCRNCGNTIFHNLEVLGIRLRP